MGQRRRIGLGVLLVPAATGLMMGAMLLADRMGWGMWVPGVVLLLAIVATIAAERRHTRSRFASACAAEYAREGLCGACVYPLRGTPPDPDGCVVCPECGAAWRVGSSRA